MIKGIINEDNIIVIKLYALNNLGAEYIKKKLLKIHLVA